MGKVEASKFSAHTPMTSVRWTPELRARQAPAIHAWRPWERSTGPRTPSGNAVAAGSAPGRLHEERTAFTVRREKRGQQRGDAEGGRR